MSQSGSAPDRAELERLTRRAHRPGRLTAAEIDLLVQRYQDASTDLALLRATGGDRAQATALAATVTRARAAVTGARAPLGRAVLRFAGDAFPTEVWERRRWCVGVAVGFLLVAAALGVWVALDPGVQSALLPPAAVANLVDHQFAAYYRSAPAAAFAARVWTNNAVVAAAALTTGVALGIPTLLLLAQNAANVGVAAGLLIAHGRAAEFFDLILPHGMLELSAVFIAAATGLRLGWRVIDPGESSRGAALAAEGRGAVVIAVGLVGVLFVSGILEAFVTPAPLPAWLRLGIGGLVELALITLVIRRGRPGGRCGDAPGSPAKPPTQRRVPPFARR